MTANKMPEMPEAKFWWKPPTDTPLFYYNDSEGMRANGFTTLYAEADVIADRRACYLAGIAAARGELPVRLHGENAWVAGHNACRATTLANLTALEQEAKK